MQLTVLGCAGTYPAPDSPCSSYLLEAQGYRLLLDLGSGAVGALARHHPGGDLRDIDAALISHLHGDHWLDLVPYAYARRYAPGGAAPPLPVYSPSGGNLRPTGGGRGSHADLLGGHRRLGRDRGAGPRFRYLPV